MRSHFPPRPIITCSCAFSKIAAAFLNSMNVNASSWRAADNDRTRGIPQPNCASSVWRGVSRGTLPSIPRMLRSIFGPRGRHKLSQSVTTRAFTCHSLAAKIRVQSKRSYVSRMPQSPNCTCYLARLRIEKNENFQIWNIKELRFRGTIKGMRKFSSAFSDIGR